MPERHYSAGGVILRVREGVPEVAMIATHRGERWGLPKGTVDPGEQPEQTALREVREETGLRGEAIRLLDRIEYFFRARGALVHKHVDFFLMRYIEGELSPQLSEVDDARWFPLAEAIRKSSFGSERKVLEMVSEYWSSLEEAERERYVGSLAS